MSPQQGPTASGSQISGPAATDAGVVDGAPAGGSSAPANGAASSDRDAGVSERQAASSMKQVCCGLRTHAICVVGGVAVRFSGM